MKNEIDVDGGIVNPTFFAQYGQGYAKVNHNSKRVNIYLSSKDNTSQEAEIFAIICGICECLKTKKTTIITDSHFWYDAITKNWKVKEPRLKLPYRIAQSLIKFYKLTLIWKSRENNKAT